MNEPLLRSKARGMTPWVWMLGAGAALLLPTAAEAQTVHRHTRSVVENQTVDLNVLRLFPGNVDPLSVDLVEGPKHGSLEPAPFALTYRPAGDYFGLDGATFEGTSTVDGLTQTHTVDLQLWVLPRVLPIAGVFDNSYYGAPGFYDLAAREFILCSPWVGTGGPSLPGGNPSVGDPWSLTCERRPVVGAEVGWIPVVWDWLGEGRNQIPSLFDPSTGTLYRLIPEIRVKRLRVAPVSIQIGGAQWTWPVAGDWDGDGVETLAFYRHDGTVTSVHNPHSSGAQTGTAQVLRTWPANLPYSGNKDELPWPYAVPESGKIVLRLHDGYVWRWLAEDGTGGRQMRYHPYPGIPVYHPHWGFGSFGLLSFTRVGDTFWLTEVNDFDPHTIALKFHNDPPDP
ncbi:MAG: hypothetical protein AAGN66_15410 [Acidobacteriota bacterium]